MKAYAEAVVDGKYPDFYKYEEQIGRIVAKSDVKGHIFGFGNIQKLINMTMKYLFIRYYDNVEREYFFCCHAPVDSIMRDKVFQELKEKREKHLVIIKNAFGAK